MRSVQYSFYTNKEGHCWQYNDKGAFSEEGNDWLEAKEGGEQGNKGMLQRLQVIILQTSHIRTIKIILIENEVERCNRQRETDQVRRRLYRDEEANSVLGDLRNT